MPSLSPADWWTEVDACSYEDLLTSQAKANRPAFTEIVMNVFSHGTVHQAGEDLQMALRADPKLLNLWETLTPLGRNEFICWIEDAKKPSTRQRRIQRTGEELLEGKKRPCCWAGCIHRTDKAPSRWQQAVLIDKKDTRG